MELLLAAMILLVLVLCWFMLPAQKMAKRADHAENRASTSAQPQV